MKDIELAVYRTTNLYRGHSSINRYHWEVGFKCYRVDNSEARALGIRVNGELPQDYLGIRFFNHKDVITRVSRFSTQEEANEVVKEYMNRGFRRV